MLVFCGKHKYFPCVNKQYSLSCCPFFTQKWYTTNKTLQKERDLLEYEMKLIKTYTNLQTTSFTIVAQVQYINSP